MFSRAGQPRKIPENNTKMGPVLVMNGTIAPYKTALYMGFTGVSSPLLLAELGNCYRKITGCWVYLLVDTP